MKLLCMVTLIFLVVPSLVSGSENCAMMNGQCRDVCNPDEEILEGAFIDCGDRQECCITKSPSREHNENTGKESRWNKPME